MGGKVIPASFSRVGRPKELGSCFGVKGESEPESDSPSRLGSRVVHIVDRD